MIFRAVLDRCPPVALRRANRAIRSSSPRSEFIESEYREAQAEASRELQLVLDPEFL
jgi:hypothetical protein